MKIVIPIHSLITLVVVTLSFFLGCVSTAFSSIPIDIACCLGAGALVAVVNIVQCYIQNKRIEDHNNERSRLFGKPITSVIDDGSYALRPEDIYDAIEKLGYYEHEMNWRDVNETNK